MREILRSAPGVLFFNGAGDNLGPVSAGAIDLVEKYILGVRTYDVSRNRSIRREVMAASNWDFFPQLFVGEEFIGGWAIMPEFFHSGEFHRISSSTALQEPERRDTLVKGRAAKIWRYCYDEASDALCGAASDGTLRLLRPAIAGQHTKLLIADGWVNASAVIGERGFSALTDGSIVCSNLLDGQPLGKLVGHKRWVNDIVADPSGATLWSVSADRYLVEWDANRLFERVRCKSHEAVLWCVECSKDGSVVATGCADGIVRLWRSGTLEFLAEVQLGSLCVTDLSAVEGGFVASTFSGTVFVLGGRLEVQAKLEGHTERAWTVAAIEDAGMIASSGGDGTVRVWKIGSGEEVACYRFEVMPIALAWVVSIRSLAIGFADGSEQLIPLPEVQGDRGW